MMLGEVAGLKGRAPRAGEPVAALDPAALAQRIAVMPFRAGWVRRRGCHFYFARGVTFQPCADIICTRNIEMTPLCKVEVTLPRVSRFPGDAPQVGEIARRVGLSHRCWPVWPAT
jgi:hypothetical protein